MLSDQETNELYDIYLRNHPGYKDLPALDVKYRAASVSKFIHDSVWSTTLLAVDNRTAWVVGCEDDGFTAFAISYGKKPSCNRSVGSSLSPDTVQFMNGMAEYTGLLDSKFIKFDHVYDLDLAEDLIIYNDCQTIIYGDGVMEMFKSHHSSRVLKFLDMLSSESRILVFDFNIDSPIVKNSFGDDDVVSLNDFIRLILDNTSYTESSIICQSGYTNKDTLGFVKKIKSIPKK